MKFTTHFELHSQTTRLVEGASHGVGHRSQTGFSPSVTSCSKEFRPVPHPRLPLQITTRTLRPDFKFELLPLHSPLLRQSLLVSFPPLIDMLKFSGYPYLIRGQSVGTIALCLCFSWLRGEQNHKSLEFIRLAQGSPIERGVYFSILLRSKGRPNCR